MIAQQYAAAAAAKGMEVDEQRDRASNKRKQYTFAVEAQGAMLMQVQMQQVAQAPTQSPQVLHAPFQQPQAPGGAKRLRS